jgi:ureidoglycolate hydrolase
MSRLKFNKALAVTSTPLEGIADYERGFADGILRKVDIEPTDRREDLPVWRVFAIEDDAEYGNNRAAEPLEISGMIIQPRAFVVDELTRHRTTNQLFIPIGGSFLAVVAGSRPDDPDSPDPDRLTLVPVKAGEVFEVCLGTWHTLPFAFVHPVYGLSVMNRETMEAYHDVRDLTAEGWVGVLMIPDKP